LARSQGRTRLPRRQTQDDRDPLDPGIFLPAALRRLRLRTNLEVFWDQLAWAQPRDDSLAQTKRLPLREAALRYRGFSVIQAADSRSPELPQYDRLMGATPRWRDLEATTPVMETCGSCSKRSMIAT